MGEINTMVDGAPTKPSSAMLMTMQDKLVIESQREYSVALGYLKIMKIIITFYIS